MCIIIDANVVARVFKYSRDDAAFRELADCLFGGGTPTVRLVYGGKLLREYKKVDSILRLLATLDKAGRARRCSDQDVDAEETNVRRLRLCVSDDEHIIALAKVASVRVLCSHDSKLQQDFCNKQLLDKPRGTIYQDASHTHLLRTACTKRRG